jgi:hypothetical protein
MFEALVIGAVLGAAEVHAPGSPEDVRPEYFRVQLIADAGLPDGLGVGLSLAPLPHIRLSVAGLTNIIGFGVRGGLALVPFSDWTLHPILEVNAGRYFTGDARQIVATAPSHFTYDFAEATVGLELMFRVLVIRLGGGVARVWATASESSIGGVSIQGVMPAAKLAIALRLN